MYLPYLSRRVMAAYTVASLNGIMLYGIVYQTLNYICVDQYIQVDCGVTPSIRRRSRQKQL